MPTVSVDGIKSDRCLEQRQSMERGGIHCWMCGVAELGDQNILYYSSEYSLLIFFTAATNYSSVSKKKIPTGFW